MNKLQQFEIYSIEYKRLKNNGYNLRLKVEDARRDGEIIEVADNEMLRHIRMITNHEFDKCVANELLKNIRKSNRTEKKKLIKEYTDMIFINELVCVHFENSKELKELGKKGFKINGKEFKWIICGASQQRTNRCLYCRADIYNDLIEFLSCGANIDELEIVLAKWNAYTALLTSATYQVSKPRVVVVPDCEKTRATEVDWVDEENNIDRTTKELKFNLFDGMGLISPEFAQQWAYDLGITDYLPSSFVCRCAFIKGNLMVFDFKQFGKEVAPNGGYIKDLWGKEYRSDDIDIILTESQFKLWKGYDSWEHYETEIVKRNIHWGVTKVAPKKDSDYFRTNYQFIQVLDLTDEDIGELCEPTISWIKDVCGGDIDKTKLYLMGKIANSENAKEVWDRVQDYSLKALMLDDRLLQDTYIKNKIIKSLNKRIRESKFGKLLVSGNHQEIFGDGYALCEHAFGMEVKGLLNNGEHYSHYWNEKGVNTVCAMRSPLTWRSEVNKLNFKKNDRTEKWFKYMTSGIILNIHGCDNMLFAGSDYDGDEVFTTDNKQFLKGRVGGVPVAYEAKKAKSKKIVFDELSEVSGYGFNTKIGYLTNLSTTMYEMQNKFSKESAEYSEIEHRLKLCCALQSACIDSAKGIAFSGVPKEWTRYKKGEEEYDKVSNSIIIEDRPYFMRYLYSQYNHEYNNINKDFEQLIFTIWGKKTKELTENDKGTELYQEILDYMCKKMGLLTTNGVMNKVCRKMEDELKELRCKSNKTDPQLYSILSSGVFEKNDEKIKKMEKIFAEYSAYKANRDDEDIEFKTFEQFCKYIRHKAIIEIGGDINELADIAVYICYYKYPNKPKDFCWNVFGKGIIENMTLKYTEAKVISRDDSGECEYLGQRYKINNIQLICDENDFEFLGDLWDYDN